MISTVISSFQFKQMKHVLFHKCINCNKHITTYLFFWKDLYYKISLSYILKFEGSLIQLIDKYLITYIFMLY